MQVSCRSDQQVIEDELCALHTDIGRMPVMSKVQTYWYDTLSAAILSGDFSEVLAEVRRAVGPFVVPAFYIRRAVALSIR